MTCILSTNRELTLNRFFINSQTNSVNQHFSVSSENCETITLETEGALLSTPCIKWPLKKLSMLELKCSLFLSGSQN
uniref:Uncharacterized protein n=1 Tax=Anguilla anguilla TaxID=7936 RepID=A0A0E9XH95_ANGAN